MKPTTFKILFVLAIFLVVIAIGCNDPKHMEDTRNGSDYYNGNATQNNSVDSATMIKTNLNQMSTDTNRNIDTIQRRK